MNLQICTDFENGLRAIDRNGEEIIKFVQWREEYFGDETSGLEYPKNEGQAVLIKKDKLDIFLDLFNNELKLKSFSNLIRDD